MIENPDVSAPLVLWRSCEGKIGVDGFLKLSAQGIQAIDLISYAHAEKVSEDMKNNDARAGKK